MKKVLFATTAVVAFAGAASADVVLSGSAEMGIFDAETTVGGVAGPSETQFHTDFDIRFTLSGETDGGLTFGATLDLDEAGVAAFAPATQGGEAIFISGGFGTLTMGDTDGAFDWAMTETDVNAGSIQDNQEHAGWQGNGGLDGLYGGQILRYDNTFGDFGVAVSMEMDDTGFDDDVLGLGLRYNLDLGGTTVALGLGYQETTLTAAGALGTATPALVGDHEFIGLSAAVGFGDIDVVVNYSDFDRPVASGLSGDHMGIGLGYTMGAYAFHANYGETDLVGLAGNEGFGLSVGYDLGGGAVVQFGYGNGEATDAAGLVTETDTWSFGVAMSF